MNVILDLHNLVKSVFNTTLLGMGLGIMRPSKSVLGKGETYTNLKVWNNSNWSMIMSDFKMWMPFIILVFTIKLPKASMSIPFNS